MRDRIVNQEARQSPGRYDRCEHRESANTSTRECTRFPYERRKGTLLHFREGGSVLANRTLIPKIARMELTTIKFSHFNEKARWALDRFGVAYTERAYMPMLHMPFAIARNRFMRSWDGTSTAATTPVLFTGRS